MAKTQRNDQCPCGSGKKFKKCCAASQGAGASGGLMLLLVGGAVLAAIIVGIASFTGNQAGPSRVWSAQHGHYHDASGTAVP